MIMNQEVEIVFNRGWYAVVINALGTFQVAEPSR